MGGGHFHLEQLDHDEWFLELGGVQFSLTANADIECLEAWADGNTLVRNQPEETTRSASETSDSTASNTSSDTKRMSDAEMIDEANQFMEDNRELFEDLADPKNTKYPDELVNFGDEDIRDS